MQLQAHHTGRQASSSSGLAGPAPRLRARGPRPCRSAAQSATRTEPGALKDRIKRLAGTKYGLDRPEADRAAVEAAARELGERGEVKDLDMTGTDWVPVYTNAKGTSSGKFGPFIGDVTQVFPAGQRGQYINKVDFSGFIKVDLLADYAANAARDRIDVEFVNATFRLGPFSLTRKFPPGYKGHWSLKYVDDDLRVFNSNIGSLFVLSRVQ